MKYPHAVTKGESYILHIEYVTEWRQSWYDREHILNVLMLITDGTSLFALCCYQDHSESFHKYILTEARLDPTFGDIIWNLVPGILQG